MKVSILTLHSVNNYGTQLQAYATQEKFKEFFDEVDFIDYRRKDTYGIGLIKTFSKGNIIRTLAILPTIAYWKIIFLQFKKRYLNISKPKYLNESSIRNIKINSDAYIVGSDQVWNSGWNKGIIAPMYLNFVPKTVPKYSFSSSFGRKIISQEEVNKSKKYIDSFNYISVREESGINILKKQFKYQNVEKIIDPTLLMTAKFWRNLSGKRKIKEKYILIYNLNKNKKLDEYAKKLSESTGLKLYRFCTRFDQIFRSGRSIIIPKIFDFINYIDNAEFVLTDSFHATAFSINLNTTPICIYPKDYSNRISEFLKMVECENIHLENFNNFEITKEKIDFEKTNKILEEERKKANKFLNKIKRDMMNYEK